jgi:CHAT domain-containing protein
MNLKFPILFSLFLFSLLVALWHGSFFAIATAQISSASALELVQQGKSFYQLGEFDAALNVWQQAAAAYQQVGDEEGRIGSIFNQSQAMQGLGMYRRACQTLREVVGEDKNICESDSQAKVSTTTIPTTPAISWQLQSQIWLSFGDVLRVIGHLNQAKTLLEERLKIAEQGRSPEIISQIRLSLGKTFIALNRVRLSEDKPSNPQLVKDAATAYQIAASTATFPLTKLQAQVNYLSLLLENEELPEAEKMWQQIQPQIAQLPPEFDTIELQINLAKIILANQIKKIKSPDNIYGDFFRAHQIEVARIAASAVEGAQKLENRRLQSFALGTLGGIYEQSDRWIDAEKLTKAALNLSQSVKSDISYQWQWQLGRILKNRGKIKEAIANYQAAFNTLQSLRSDLITLSPNVQFSFLESVEPIYRQLVDLLLPPGKITPTQDDLKIARDVMEALQKAELENFLRCSLQNDKQVAIDREVDPKAAVIYPIILGDRIEVILSLYKQPLERHSQPLPSNYDLSSSLKTLQVSLKEDTLGTDNFLPNAQKIYKLLLGEKIDIRLKQNQVETLVFVLDSSLRNIPMAALHDGKQYLIEKYAIAISPGLQLLEPKPLVNGRQLEILAAGISKSVLGLPALFNVINELNQVTSIGSSISPLLNESFTENNLKQNLNSRPFPIIHLATHAKFGSQLEDTFILAWQEKININKLSILLQTRQTSSSQPIELLTLSACETATSSKQASLGLAGVAIRSGARSTLGTLWQVNDKSTAEIMVEFYQVLVKHPEITKAKALQKAQVQLLNQGKKAFYWSPYILIGNWL